MPEVRQAVRKRETPEEPRREKAFSPLRVACEVVHFGSEYGPIAEAVRHELASGNYVTMVGDGTSMEPYIMDGTRMVFRPWDDDDEPRVGLTVMVFGYAARNHPMLNTHMIGEVDDSDDTFRMISSEGWNLGWYRQRSIIGKYIGDWKLCRQRVKTGVFYPLWSPDEQRS